MSDYGSADGPDAGRRRAVHSYTIESATGEGEYLGTEIEQVVAVRGSIFVTQVEDRMEAQLRIYDAPTPAVGATVRFQPGTARA